MKCRLVSIGQSSRSIRHEILQVDSFFSEWSHFEASKRSHGSSVNHHHALQTQRSYWKVWAWNSTWQVSLLKWWFSLGFPVATYETTAGSANLLNLVVIDLWTTILFNWSRNGPIVLTTIWELLLILCRRCIAVGVCRQSLLDKWRQQARAATSPRGTGDGLVQKLKAWWTGRPASASLLHGDESESLVRAWINAV